MRKALSSVLIIIFVTASVGISLNSHYCGGRLLKTEIFSKPKCPFCQGMMSKKEMECCDDESERIAIEDDFSVTVFKVESAQYYYIGDLYPSQEILEPVVGDQNPPQELAKPPPRTVPIYIFLSQYNFYG